MRNLLLKWPSLVTALVVVLNVDLVVMPALAAFGVHGWTMFWVATIAATAEVLYWHWYAGWLARNMTSTRPARRLRADFEDRGLLEVVLRFWHSAKYTGQMLWVYWCDHAKQQIEVNTPFKKQMLKDAERLIRNTHILVMYPLMIGLGLCPVGWAFGIALNRTVKAPLAFPLLLAFNALKAWGLGIAYLAIPLWAKLSLLGLVLTLIVIKAVRIVRIMEAEAEDLDACSE